MKKNICIFLLNMVFAFQAYAQNNFSTTESLIKELSSKEIKAILKHDHKSLEEIWEKDFMVNNPYNMVIKGRSQVLERMKSGVINYSVFERDIEEMMVMENTVIEMGLETIIPKEGAPMAGQKVLRRYTNFWMLEEGKWMIKARHANVICEGLE